MAITQGADVYLELMTFHGPLQPIRMAVGHDLNPDYVRHDYNIGGAANLKANA